MTVERVIELVDEFLKGRKKDEQPTIKEFSEWLKIRLTN